MSTLPATRDAATVAFLASAAGPAAGARPAPAAGQVAAVAEWADVVGFLSTGVLRSTSQSCDGSILSSVAAASAPALAAAWSAAASRRAPPAGRGQTLTSAADAALPEHWTSTVGRQAKLNAAPGDDGAPPDPQTEAAVDELNETLAEGPDEGQSWESWEAEIEDLVDQINDTPEPCPKFDPPTTGDCPLVGSLSTCGPPCIDERPDGCDIHALPYDDADGRYDFVYSIEDVHEVIDWEAVDMVQYAWAVLLDNLDLVEWMACLFYGEPAHDSNLWESLGEVFGVAGSVGECLSEKIEGKAPDVTIRFTHEDGDGAFWTDANALTGGTIYIPIEGTRWQNDYVAKFKAAPSGSAEQFCIVADLAATLLHELVHSCLTGGSADAPGGDDSSNTCSTSYLIENNFRWALGQRYPCLCPTGSCGYYLDGRLWRNDGAAYPGDPPW